MITIPSLQQGNVQYYILPFFSEILLTEQQKKKTPKNKRDLSRHHIKNSLHHHDVVNSSTSLQFIGTMKMPSLRWIIFQNTETKSFRKQNIVLSVPISSFLKVSEFILGAEMLNQEYLASCLPNSTQK